MGYGLGKDSPVVLSLGKGNFEALIDRHGQWLRWLIAKKCPCLINNRPDPHCEKCGGFGDIYSYQREYEDIYRATVRDNIIPVPEEYIDAVILEVYNAHGKKFEFCRCGDFVQIIGARIQNNELVDVRFRAPLVKRIESVTLQKIGGGCYRVPGILTKPSMLEGVYYQAPGDVISVSGLKDENGDPVEVLGYRLDMVVTESQAETLTAASVEYILPFRFIVLSQNLSKEDTLFLNAHKGDAVCTFPYSFNVSENDLLTVLSGNMTHKINMEHTDDPDDPDDILTEFFVSKVDNIETKEASFKEGEDFILVGSNKIHWIGNQPNPGEIMAVSYRYLPTYRIFLDIPSLRTSEDQRIPRKVALRLYSAFAESKGVNVNAS